MAALNGRRVLCLLLLPYVLWLILAYRYHFIDGVNLLFHEAGHLFFGLLGSWPHFLGGSLGQLVFPLACMIQFQRQGQPFERWVCTLWLAESLMYLAEYLGDAKVQRLPLVGGHIHDWNWMLSRLGLLDSAPVLAFLVHAGASLLLLYSLNRMWRLSAPNAGNFV